jgi:hypothetical protein
MECNTMTGDSGLALTLYAGVVTWVAAGLAILAVREHQHMAAWRRRARRIVAVRRLARHAVRAIRRSARRGASTRRPAVVVRCTVPVTAGASAREAAEATTGHILEARRPGTTR